MKKIIILRKYVYFVKKLVFPNYIYRNIQTNYENIADSNFIVLYLHFAYDTLTKTVQGNSLYYCA